MIIIKGIIHKLVYLFCVGFFFSSFVIVGEFPQNPRSAQLKTTRLSRLITPSSQAAKETPAGWSQTKDATVTTLWLRLFSCLPVASFPLGKKIILNFMI